MYSESTIMCNTILLIFHVVIADYMAEIMMFSSCNKELAISISEIPFFNFYFELIILTSNLAEGNYISDFQISRDIVDDNGETQGTPGPPLTYDFMVGWLLISHCIYFSFNH